MIIHNNITQKTPEWLKIRAWKLTASNATAIWNCWKWLDTYVIETMAEFYSSAPKETYTNEHIERWNELEEIARSMYELENWVEVKEVWFCEYNEFVWCSPDWLVWDDWGIEIKCQWDKKHFLMILNWEKEIDSSYIWQIQMNLLITERKWWDFISYNPNFEKSLIVFRIYPDLEKFEALKKGFEIWEKKILEIKWKIQST